MIPWCYVSLWQQTCPAIKHQNRTIHQLLDRHPPNALFSKLYLGSYTSKSALSQKEQHKLCSMQGRTFLLSSCCKHLMHHSWVSWSAANSLMNIHIPSKVLPIWGPDNMAVRTMERPDWTKVLPLCIWPHDPPDQLSPHMLECVYHCCEQLSVFGFVCFHNTTRFQGWGSDLLNIHNISCHIGSAVSWQGWSKLIGLADKRTLGYQLCHVHGLTIETKYMSYIIIIIANYVRGCLVVRANFCTSKNTLKTNWQS